MPKEITLAFINMKLMGHKQGFCPRPVLNWKKSPVLLGLTHNPGSTCLFKAVDPSFELQKVDWLGHVKVSLQNSVLKKVWTPNLDPRAMYLPLLAHQYQRFSEREGPGIEVDELPSNILTTL